MAGHCEGGQRSRAQVDCCLVAWRMRLSLLGLRNPEEGVPGAHGTFKFLATGRSDLWGCTARCARGSPRPVHITARVEGKHQEHQF